MGDEAAEDMRRRNERFHHEMARDGDYAAERRANAKHQQARRKKGVHSVLTDAEQRKCKALRLAAQTVPGGLHVDHMLPLKLEGQEQATFRSSRRRKFVLG